MRDVLPLRNPHYIRLYKFERDFNFGQWRLIMSDYWGLCVSIVIIYVTLILKGRRWMKDRSPIACQGLLVTWNIVLAMFSALAFRRNIPEIWDLWFATPNGLHMSICSRKHFSQGTALWELIGIISKVVELGDTGFIVLRKQPLIFLHWYHHATVLMYTWYTYGAHDPSHRIFMTMNFGVHVFLYTYYAFKALRYRVPRKIAAFVTSVQLAQMVVGIAANVYSLAVLQKGGDCDRDPWNVQLALGMYVSYFILFSTFFWNTYVVPPVIVSTKGHPAVAGSGSTTAEKEKEKASCHCRH